MNTIEREEIHKVKRYIAKDGKEFDSESACRHHEMLLDGTRKICTNCNGKGGHEGEWVEPYDHWDGRMGGYYKWITCPICHGKGYLEKKVTWE